MGTLVSQSYGPLRLRCMAGALLAISSLRLLGAACVPPSSGLVDWWPGEGNALDLQGTNNGTFTDPQYAPGEVGQAFNFDGRGNNVRIPASPVMNVGAGPGMTIEAWIYSTDSSSRPIVEWVPPTVGAFGAHFYVHQNGAGTLYANLYDNTGTSHIIQTAPGLVQLNAFQHVAVTYDKASGIAALYVNGALSQQVVLGTFTPQTSPDLSIGYRPGTVPFGPISFLGRIDEVSLYSRALSSTEIQAIYLAGTAGKCLSGPPVISQQPTSQAVFVGSNTTFNVSATGTAPFTYQWSMDGTNIPGATGDSLDLTNLQAINAGTYAVAITNSLGFAISSNAVLTVNPLPSCALPPVGIAGWWPAEGNANDLVGTDNGTILTGITFVPGLVGQAFNFDGVNGAVIVPASPTLYVQDLTVETWIFPTDVSSPRPIFEYANTNGLSALNFWYGLGAGAQPASGALFAAARDALNPGGNNFYIASPPGILPTNQWSHVAFTFDSVAGKAALYLNGAPVALITLGGPLHPNTTLNVNLGYRPVGSADLYAGRRHVGKLDEVTLYGRALSAGEIQGIYSAEFSGKCPTPISPYIVVQPTNQTALAGWDVTLNAPATGSQPLAYQWSFEGNPLPGQTTGVLTLTNVQVNQTGTYTVQVTNLAGLITSSNAVLTVTPAPPCAPPPTGLVSWWRGEGNANDNEGANNGVFNTPQYGPGEVGQGFSFDGSGNYVRVPASPSMNVGAGNGMTIEAWINPTATARGPIAEWIPNVPGAFGSHFYVNASGPGALYANLYDTANTSHIIETTNGAVAFNTFQHVALTYDKPSGIAQLFLNGTLLVQTNLGTFTPQTSPDLSLGYRPSGNLAFVGRIDEVSLYSRALSAPEIQAIYNAGGSGKCNVPVPPAVFLQPARQAVTIGQTATFQVQAGGTAPLNYQWIFNNNLITGATNSSLILTNVQMSQAGDYWVVVTNNFGSATSSNATLVVNFPPAAVSVGSASGTAGQLVTVPIVLLANGNENGLGFSLNYSPALLTNAGVTLGSGASGASLVVNPNQAGAIGIGVALPSGSTFAPGTQQVAVVSFTSAVAATGYSTTLSFGDQPTSRALSDAKANQLPVNFTGGQVTLSRSSFEADVAPRPNGDGKVDITDWVQVGRFVAALDIPSPSEFQRADCAPRDTFGDGQLTVSDWVQAGRYAAGLDPLTMAGGPTAPVGGQVVVPRRRKGTNPTRALTVQGPLIFDGQTGTAFVQLNAQGDENAVGFSLSFDPTVVTYTGASAGADALGAAIDVNSNYATNGELGIILGLPTDTSFSPGVRQLVKVTFQAVTAASVNSSVALTDVPVKFEVSDTNAVSVVATSTNGIIEVNPKPSLAITQASQSLTLSWPLWATNYTLQQAASPNLATSGWTNLTLTPVATTNGLNATVPVSSAVRFYRLQHQ